MGAVTLAEAVSSYGASLRRKLSNPAISGQPEEQLRTPLDALIRDLAEIGDVAECLVKMGAKIEGIHTSTLKITGVTSLHGTEHEVIADRIETGTYAMAAAMAGGNVLLKGAKAESLASMIDVLRRAGISVQDNSEGLRIERNGQGIEPVNVDTDPYPGFPTDLQAQLMALMTKAKGTAMIRETIFENRFMHVNELVRLGAHIQIDGKTALVDGVTKLSGATVQATDLRASACLVIAGLVADGETTIERIYHLDRGYDQMEIKLRGLGAKIERLKE
mgnify:CR=1 FL=1